MSISKNLKKLLSLLTVVCMVFALIPATVSFAGTDDVVSAAQKLRDLTDDDARALILEKLWEFGISEVGAGDTLTADDLVNEVLTVLPNDIESDVIGDGTGKISKATLTLFAGKLLKYRSSFLSEYSQYSTVIKQYLSDAKIKEVLGLPTTATQTDVYKKLMSSAFPVVKLNGASSAFEKSSNFATATTAYVNSLKTDDVLLKGAATALITKYSDDMMQKVNNAIVTYKFSTANVNDIAAILRTYNLCEAATSTGGGTTTGGGSIGGGAVVTPTPAPTSTPAPAGTGLSDALTNLGNILDKIATLDTAAATTAASDAIKAIGNIDVNKLTLADEKALQTKVEALVEAVLEKASVQTVAPVVTGDVAKAQLSDTEIAKTIDAVVAAAEKLSGVVKASKLDVAVEKAIVLNAKSGKDVSSSSVEFTTKVLAALNDKKIDSVELKTDIATVKIAPKDLGNGKDAVTVTVSKPVVADQYKKVVGDSIVVDLSVKAGDKTITNFSKPVEVSIPYTLKAGEDKNNITVFYVKADGTLENVAGTYDEATKSVIFTTKHFSMYVVKNNPVAFADVKTADWYKVYVETMAAKGIILGTDGSFLPEDKITRAEFAALLVRGFKLSDDTAVNSFSDIQSTDWFAKDVAAAAKTGIVSGVGDGAFAPNDNISRQDMAVMIARALKLVKNKSGVVLTSSNGLFKDYSSIDSYAQTGVATAAKYAVIKGLPDGTFAPKADATRAEAATMIYNLFFLK